PGLMLLMRLLYLMKRASDHLFYLDLTVASGRSAVLAWKLGVLKVWQRIMLPRFAARRAQVERPPPARRTVPIPSGPVAARYSMRAEIFLGVLLWGAAARAADIAGKDIKLPATERQVRVTYFHAPGDAKRPAALLLHGAGGFDRRIKDYNAYASTLANAGID